MLWAIYAKDKAGALEKRMAERADHLDYLGDFGDQIVLAGASLTDDGETMTGSVIVVNMASREDVVAFSNGDPFTTAGVFESVDITRMRRGVWHPDNIPES